LSIFRYAIREMFFRRGRSIVTTTSVALAVLAAVLLTALATSYSRAIRKPIETVGADVIVQMTGDIPQKLEGLVFPHPNALLPATQVAEIRVIPGVVSLTRAVYMWELAPDHFQSVLGIEDGEAGLSGLGSRLIDGKALTAGDRAVLVDSDFATKNSVRVGSELNIGGTMYPVVGVIDAARSGKVVRADVYMPLAVAQGLAVAAPQVQSLYPFKSDDVNLLLVKVDRQHLEDVVDKIGLLLGKKGIVSSELSFRQALEWLIKGRLPVNGEREILVERHYGAFYRLEPGSSIDIAGNAFKIVGVVEIKEGSQIAASNFYMEIGAARELGSLPPGLVNQVFLKVADMAETESIKQRIAKWMPRASIASSGTMLQLFGGVSQTIGSFRSVGVAAGAAAAQALSAMLVLGALTERRKEMAVLRVIGWESSQVRRQIAVEMAVQGLLAGLLAIGLVAIGNNLFSHITIAMPASLPGENPVDFAAGGFHAAASALALPVSTTLWDWLSPAIASALTCGAWGWWWSADATDKSLWAAVKST